MYQAERPNGKTKAGSLPRHGPSGQQVGSLTMWDRGHGTDELSGGDQGGLCVRKSKEVND